MPLDADLLPPFVLAASTKMLRRSRVPCASPTQLRTSVCSCAWNDGGLCVPPRALSDPLRSSSLERSSLGARRRRPLLAAARRGSTQADSRCCGRGAGSTFSTRSRARTARASSCRHDRPHGSRGRLGLAARLQSEVHKCAALPDANGVGPLRLAAPVRLDVGSRPFAPRAARMCTAGRARSLSPPAAAAPAATHRPGWRPLLPRVPDETADLRSQTSSGMERYPSRRAQSVRLCGCVCACLVFFGVSGPRDCSGLRLQSPLEKKDWPDWD
jgi:hypothetical protein